MTLLFVKLTSSVEIALTIVATLCLLSLSHKIAFTEVTFIKFLVTQIIDLIV